MNKDFYISLIARKLSKELDASQLKDLSSWLMTSKDNAVLMDDFKSVWKLTGNYHQGVSVNVDEAFKSFSNKYKIPKADPSVLEAFAKKKISFSIKYSVLIVLAVALCALLYFSGVFFPKKVENENMHIMTMQLDEFSDITLAPNANFYKGASEKLDSKQSSDYSNLFTVLENNKGDDQLVEGSNYYKSIASLFEPKEKNFMIEDFEGQAFFELKSINENQAFLGLGSGISVGTRDGSFNIQNYGDEDEIVLDIESGTVVLYDGQNNAYLIKAGDRAVFDKSSKKLRKESNPKLSPFKWHKGILIFDNTPLEEVFDKIERFYGVDVEVVDGSSMEEINFTATLSMSSNLNDCLELLHESIEMTIRRKGLRNIEVSKIRSN